MEIYECITKSNINKLKELVDDGANIHVDNDYSMELAATVGNLEIVKYLMRLGVSVHTRNDAALRFASGNGHLEIVKYLICKGANVRALIDSAIVRASGNGHGEIVGVLLDNGADVSKVYITNEIITNLFNNGRFYELVKILENNKYYSKIKKDATRIVNKMIINTICKVRTFSDITICVKNWKI